MSALKKLILDTPQEHFDLLHQNDARGTVIFWEKAIGNKSNVWHKIDPTSGIVPAFLTTQAGQPDRFVSVNEFYGWRLIRLLKSLRACYVDIDGVTDVKLALDRLMECRLPPPSVVVESGTGLHFYWLHNALPSKMLPIWQGVQSALCKMLHGLAEPTIGPNGKPLIPGSDPKAKDCTRVLRLVGSVNSKNAEVVRGLVFDPQPWDFELLRQEVLGYRVENIRSMNVHRVYGSYKQPEREPSANSGQRSILSRWHAVYRDLVLIGEQWGGIAEGAHNELLFLTAVALSWFAEPAALRSEINCAARILCPRWHQSKISSTVSSVMRRAEDAAEGLTYEYDGVQVDPRYKFTRATLWERMQAYIPPHLEDQMRAIISKEKKAQRREESHRKRDGGRTPIAEHLAKVKATSANTQKPWDALGISRATYYRRKAQS